jgi:hypothetical protein
MQDVLTDSFQDPTNESSRTHLKQAIEKLLTETAAHPPQSRICPRCGRAMRHLNATFSLYGSDTQWNIQLPVCPCSTSGDFSERNSEANVFLAEHENRSSHA